MITFTATQRKRRKSTPATDPARPDPSALLEWYDRNRRTMPWRARPGKSPDPYRVWLSEIMLQQTTVRAVKPYFERFVSLFPTVQALADAPTDDVMKAWAGLGYYSRARNLHACAKAVVARFGGQFPADEEALRALPGIGAYTSAAIASIAFDRRADRRRRQCRAGDRAALHGGGAAAALPSPPSRRSPRR